MSCVEPSKLCPACNEKKPLSAFGKNKRYKLGVQSYCRACQRDYDRTWTTSRINRIHKTGVELPATKLCNACGKEKASREFYLSVRHSDGLRPKCRECTSHECTQRRIESIESGRTTKETRRLQYAKNNLKRNYGITLAEYDAMSERRGGVCEICGKPETWVGRSRLAVDHDHRTGAIRGLLCASCNKAIGGFKDDPELLLAAACYIENANTRRGS